MLSLHSVQSKFKFLNCVLNGFIEQKDAQGQWVLETVSHEYVDIGNNLLYYIVDFGEPEDMVTVFSGNCECILRSEGVLFPVADENSYLDSIVRRDKDGEFLPLKIEFATDGLS